MKHTRKHIQLFALCALSMGLLAACNTPKNNTVTASQTAGKGKDAATVVANDSESLRRSDKDGMATTMPIKVPIMRLDSVAAMKINGLWTLRTINGQTLSAANGDPDETRPYINFDSRTGKFYANDGCNTINGDFIARQNNTLSLNLLLSTLMMCPDARYEQQFKQGLAAVNAFRVEQKNNENILTLLNDKDKTIMTLVRPMTDFLNGSWKVVAINGAAISNDGVKMVIDIPELKIHGNTGCNVFNGTIFVDPDRDGSIQFQEIGVTRMLCPDMDTERAFLVALESVDYAVQSGDYAILYDSKHKPALKLEPLQLQE